MATAWREPRSRPTTAEEPGTSRRPWGSAAAGGAAGRRAPWPHGEKAWRGRRGHLQRRKLQRATLVGGAAAVM